jgi:Zn-dependent M16 (insulinase) family peptidase
MNAFTSSDHTTYPFATTNQQDFKNLMSVYMDATLRPLLKADDFYQEGWRIGPENPLATDGDEASAGKTLVFKGVVYNEMKGQMSDASYLYYIRFQDHIFPAIHNSGGDPQEITNLTHQQLQDFHTRNYHPSNAKFFTYGNMPLADHLVELQSRLSQFEEAKSDHEIREPINLDAGHQYHEIPGPIDKLMDENMQHKTSTSWLTGQTSDILETFSLSIISSLLLDGYGSPLYRALIESGLGLDFSPNTGLDSSGKIGIFSVGLIGVKEENVSRIKEVIEETLVTARNEGFDPGKIDGLLHQLELSLKHKTAQFGLGLMQRLGSGWFNGTDPMSALAWNDVVEAFKSNLAKGGYLEGLVEKHLLGPNSLTFTMVPSKTYEDDRIAEEASRLSRKLDLVYDQYGGSENAKQKLEQKELELLKVQEDARDQDLSCLPTLHVKDIPRQKERKAIRDSSIGPVPVQWRETATNGLTYFRAINNFTNLPNDLRMYLPLFTDAIMRLGTKNRSMEQIEDLIKLKTGGINTSYYSSTNPTDILSGSEGLSMSGYALDGNVDAMYDLLRTILLETDFDNPDVESKLRQLMQGVASGAVGSIAESGHSYARRYAAAGLTPQSEVVEMTSGLSQVKMMARLASRSPDEGLSDVVEKLKAIQRFAISSSNSMKVAITCGPGNTATNEQKLHSFLQALPKSIQATASESSTPRFENDSKSFFPLPYQVYYSGLALPTVPYAHKSGAALQVLSQLLTHKHLHHEIREKGGAYGGGSYASGLGGIFGFYSYRDPNPQNTIKIVEAAGRWAYDRQWTERDLEEAKLSIFQSLDAPKSVSSEGMTKFLSDITEDMAQTRREQLLDVNAADVKTAAQTYIIENMQNGSMCILGEKKDWVEKNSWTVKDLGMATSAAAPPPQDV